jgi:diguanylate cyclase (GGDEF)-like protein/PAS domain S-box-containing protein
VFIGLALLIHFTFTTERGRMEQNLRTRITQDALAIAGQLESELNANVFLGNGMVAFVTAIKTPTKTEFTAALRALHQFGRHVRNVGAAPGNRISHVYPLHGNEAAIGLYYPDEPKQWPAVQRTIQSRTTTLAGPVALKQGGTGLICRIPIFFEDGRYWGILSLVLDTDSLLKAAGLRTQANGTRFAIRGKDAAGSEGAVFFGSATLFDGPSIQTRVNVPGGEWILAALPVGGWSTGQNHLFALETMALLFALLPAAMVYRYQAARLQVATSEQRVRAFMETARDGVVVIDDSGIIHEFNSAAETLFGYTAAELIGTSLNALMPATEAKQHDSRLKNPHHSGVRTMAKGRQIVGLRKDGSTFPAEISVGNALVDDKRMYVGVVRDITERKAFEQKLIDVASIDSLTGALTRRAFLEDAQNIFQLAQRHARPLSLLMVDADFFKQVNDTYGHHVGDVVLVRLADIFRDCLRTTDKLGRMGGEEFVLLLPETDQARAIVVVDRVLNAVREAVISTDAGDTLKITVSIGLVTLTPQTPDLMALLQQADEALYEAKETGRNRYQVFSGSA